MSDCERWWTLISLSIDGELDPGEAETLAAHLEACQACRETAGNFVLIQQALDQRDGRFDDDLARRLEADLLRSIGSEGAKARKSLFGGRRLPAWAKTAAAVVILAAAAFRLGPFWRQPSLTAAREINNSQVALVFDQPVRSTPPRAVIPPTTAGPEAGLPVQGPLVGQAPAGKAGPAFSAHSRAAPAGYSVSTRGNTVLVTFTMPIPPDGEFVVRTPGIRDFWGRGIGGAYLIRVDHGKVTAVREE